MAMSESSRTTAAAARLRQEEGVAAAAAQAPATHDPHQGRGRAHVESRGVRSRGAAETAAAGDSAPREGGDRGWWSDQPPSQRSGCWWYDLMDA
jgi:hypothetical protein